MQGVRGVSNLVFFLALLSIFIFPAVFADQTTNLTGLTATHGFTESFNASENPTVTATLLTSTTKPMVAGTVQAAQSYLPADGSSKTTGVSTVSPTRVTKSFGGRTYVADQVIVRYNPGRFQNARVMKAETASSNEKMGARVEKDFSNAGLSGMQVVRLPENLSVEDAIAEYQKNPDVLYAEPNYLYSISAVTPNDPYYSIEWGLHNTGQTIIDMTGTADADIDMPDAWGISTGSGSVIVAVPDTGADYTHPDLAANIWTNPGEIPGNNIDDDHNGYIDDVHGWNFITNTSDPADDNGHGTHVAGTIGAVGNNGIGVTGINWNVKIMPLKFLNESGFGYTDGAVSAILYADANGASVISNSWGGTVPSQALNDAIDSSTSIVVCAAGNNAWNNDVPGQHIYPSDFTSANIISVAATDNKDNLVTAFSNFGPTSVDLGAPGKYILSTTPGSGYQYKSGTSMATPHVSGVAALVRSVNPGLTNVQVRDMILNNVDVKSSLSGKVSTNGRLNAYKTMLAVRATVIPAADFSASPSEGTGPLTVQFTDLSTNTPTSWNWTFGDGNQTGSNLQNPVHTYFTKGNFSVSLNATNSWGSNISTKVQFINVTVIQPIAKFSVDTSEGTGPVTVQFTDLSTNRPTSWNWTFGDGNWTGSTLQNPVHTYLTKGNFTVSLNATNSVGTNTSTQVQYINVTVIQPIAKFSVNVSAGTAPVAVQFTDLSTNRPTSWNWTFGDGDWTGSNLQNPVHTYFTQGMYSVSLNATNSEGTNTSTQTQYITVTVIPPVADFSVLRTSGNAPVTIRFEDISRNAPATWNWTFGEGIANSTMQNPVYTYVNPGTYSVSLNVTNSAGYNKLTRIGYITVTNSTEKIGIFRNGGWYLDWNVNGLWDTTDAAHIKGPFGITTDTPVVGDWDGTGVTRIGIYRNGGWYLDWNNNGVWDTTDAAHIKGPFGIITDTPVVGDWDGTGVTRIGIYRDGMWYLDWNNNGVWDTTDAAHIKGPFGITTDTPVVGDWDGTGVTRIGIYRDGGWYLDWNNNGVWDTTDAAHIKGPFGGLSQDIPVVGDWDGTGAGKAGIYRDGMWYLDWNNNGVWDTTDAAHIKGPFGMTGDGPVVGYWT